MAMDFDDIWLGRILSHSTHLHHVSRTSFCMKTESLAEFQSFICHHVSIWHWIWFTGCHMLACTLLAYLTLLSQYIPKQNISNLRQLWKITILACTFCLSVVLGNISLRYIPVSFNQVSRRKVELLACVPQLCVVSGAFSISYTEYDLYELIWTHTMLIVVHDAWTALASSFMSGTITVSWQPTSSELVNNQYLSATYIILFITVQITIYGDFLSVMTPSFTVLPP